MSNEERTGELRQASVERAPAGAEPAARFTGRAADYRSARPGYPDTLVAAVEQVSGLRPGQRIADVGIGTGLSAVPFLRRGYRVVGIDPNTEMLAAAALALSAFRAYSQVACTAENSALAAASVDCALVAQAFHWLDRDAVRVELQRILRAPGRAVIVWNTRRESGSRFLEGYERLLREYGTDYLEIRRRTEEARHGLAGESGDGSAFFSRGSTRLVLENFQDLDRTTLKQRVRSASYTPSPDAPGYAPMLAAIDALFEETAQDGFVRVVYDLEVYIGRL